jgi:hypothetical protein
MELVGACMLNSMALGPGPFCIYLWQPELSDAAHRPIQYVGSSSGRHPKPRPRPLPRSGWDCLYDRVVFDRPLLKF